MKSAAEYFVDLFNAPILLRSIIGPQDLPQTWVPMLDLKRISHVWKAESESFGPLTKRTGRFLPDRHAGNLSR